MGGRVFAPKLVDVVSLLRCVRTPAGGKPRATDASDGLEATKPGRAPGADGRAPARLAPKVRVLNCGTSARDPARGGIALAVCGGPPRADALEPVARLLPEKLAPRNPILQTRPCELWGSWHRGGSMRMQRISGTAVALTADRCTEAEDRRYRGAGNPRRIDAEAEDRRYRGGALRPPCSLGARGRRGALPCSSQTGGRYRARPGEGRSTVHPIARVPGMASRRWLAEVTLERPSWCGNCTKARDPGETKREGKARKGGERNAREKVALKKREI